MLERWFRRGKAEQRFWEWFRKHDTELYDFEVDRERIFDSLSEELTRVDADLTFEFGPKIDNKREFVVSAGGIKRAFPAVLAVVSAAPQLARWKITGFRPRQSQGLIKMGDKSLDPKDVEFSLHREDEVISIRLYIPCYSDRDTTLKQLAYLLLDQALGEYDVETHVGPIEMVPQDRNPEDERHPLSELPARFDELTADMRPSRPH